MDIKNLNGDVIYSVKRDGLSNVNLSYADLRGADLGDADLSGANLSDAYLSGANLRGATGVRCFGPMSSSGRMVYLIESTKMVQAGCFWGTIDELEEKVSGDDSRKDYQALCVMFRSIAEGVSND